MSETTNCPAWCNDHKGLTGGAERVFDVVGRDIDRDSEPSAHLGSHQHYFDSPRTRFGESKARVIVRQNQDVDGRDLPQILFWHGQNGIEDIPGEVPMSYRPISRREAMELGRALIAAAEIVDEVLPFTCVCGEGVAAPELLCVFCGVQALRLLGGIDE